MDIITFCYLLVVSSLFGLAFINRVSGLGHPTSPPNKRREKPDRALKCFLELLSTGRRTHSVRASWSPSRP